MLRTHAAAYNGPANSETLVSEMAEPFDILRQHAFGGLSLEVETTQSSGITNRVNHISDKATPGSTVLRASA